MRRLARLLPLLALVTAAGCNEYHYYDINVKFNLDPASGGFSPPAIDARCDGGYLLSESRF